MNTRETSGKFKKREITYLLFEINCDAPSKIWYRDHDDPMFHDQLHVSKCGGYGNVMGALSLDSERYVIFETNVEAGLRLYSYWHTSLL
jgi:hypothetical protein